MFIFVGYFFSMPKIASDCGCDAVVHSGAYAQAAACWLVMMGWKVAAVRTFGSFHPLARHSEFQLADWSSEALDVVA